MNTIELTESLLRQIESLPDGGAFYAGGQLWTSYNGCQKPEHLGKSHGSLHDRIMLLLADGNVPIEVRSQETSRWGRGRGDFFRVVGYRVEPAKFNTAGEPIKSSDELIERLPMPIPGQQYDRSTFKAQGKTWILVEHGKAPANVYLQAHEWEYLDVSHQVASSGYLSIQAGGWIWENIAGWRPVDGDLAKYIKPVQPVKAEPKMDESKTFVRDGIEWTRWDRKSIGCPKELVGLKAGEWGFYRGTAGCIDGYDSRAFPAAAMDVHGDSYWNPANIAIVGYRVIKKVVESAKPAHKSAILTEVDRNADMIKRDGKGPLTGDALIKQLVGNGNIFGKPTPEPMHPLYRVAPISRTGTSLWGAEHNEE